MAPVLLNPSRFGGGGGGGAYPAAVLADTPLAYYRLGEPSGTTMTDSSGNSRNGTYAGTTLTLNTPGLLTFDADTCADFAGGWATVADAAWMDATDFTIEALISPDTTAGNGGIITRDGSAGSRGWNLYRFGSTLYVDNGAAPNVATATGVFAAGNKYHVAATYVAATTTVTLYVNGAAVKTATFNITTTSSANPLIIGASQAGTTGGPYNKFDGKIDEVAYYGTALSAARIAAHYDAATTYMASLDAHGFVPTTSISASYVPPVTATLSLGGFAPATSISASYVAPVDTTLDLTGFTPSLGITAQYYPEPVLCELAGVLPLPRLSLTVQKLVFVPPTTREYGDDHFFGRFGMTVGQSVVKTDGHYITTPYPWLGEIADLTEGRDWFQGGRTYDIDSATAAALLADGFTLTEV